jgi:hypothetical protein
MFRKKKRVEQLQRMDRAEDINSKQVDVQNTLKEPQVHSSHEHRHIEQPMGLDFDIEQPPPPSQAH